jgi:nucleoside-diphosphate-sugar epimerase
VPDDGRGRPDPQRARGVVLSAPRPTALITGINGFTGRYLAAELAAAGYRVFGAAHHGEEAGQDVHVVDLLDRQRLRDVVGAVRPNVVAHLAAISFVAHGDAEAIYQVNVVGTRNLLEALAALEDRPRSVLLASSANVYGNATVDVLDEAVPPAPANDYAVSKLAMEYVARLWLDRLPIVITRPFNYTGVGQSPNFLLPKIVSHFQARAPVIELGSTDVARDFSDVRMVVKVYRNLLELSPVGDVFNVCSGTTYTLSDVLRMMAGIAGYEIEVRVNTSFVRPNEVKRLLGSRRKLERAIGAVPAIPLEVTLRWMYEAPAV